MNPESAPQQPAEPVAVPALAAQSTTVSLGSLLRCAKILSVVMLTLLYLVSFILQAVGVSEIMDDCDDLKDFIDTSVGPPLQEIVDLNCQDLARPFWWASCFQLIVVVGIGISVMLNILKDMRLIMLTLLAITTLQMMERAEEALDTINRSRFEEESGRVAAAGYIISAIANLLLVFAVGIKRTPHPEVPKFQSHVTQAQP